MQSRARWKKRGRRGFAERTAINTPLQGTAADLIKLAMLKIDVEIARRGLKSRMTLQVHDELLFDAVPEEVEELRGMVQHEMEHVAEFSVPIVAEVGVGSRRNDLGPCRRDSVDRCVARARARRTDPSLAPGVSRPDMLQSLGDMRVMTPSDGFL